MTDLMLLNLNNLVNGLINNWIGPAFILIVAVVGLTLAWKRKFNELAMFAGVAAVAALLIFFGPMLFGKDGILTGAGKEVIDTVGNFIRPITLK